ncbi:hypothetical protein D3273_27645 [Lichenibacterium minor]|uniref:Uncharacterized protein n=1 Tax=Lichenibacterium minor TaxID=2316528 RepID=A0A4Q2TXB9_9HYPH|nr:hypothetical protein [Lichenibacterium minor]RYC28752.1 hypothetical protein D3273_27645 [Lichenibacterium minor]
MQKREGRSFAPPPSRPQQPEPGRTGRKRWMRPDVPRPVVPVRGLLPTLDTTLPEVDPPDPLTALDRLMLLPCEARQDIVRGAL